MPHLLNEFLVISYKENGTERWRYGGEEDYDGELHQEFFDNEYEVVAWITHLNSSCVQGSFDHYVYSYVSQVKNKPVREANPDWVKLIRGKVNIYKQL